jgi:hypothetical protein
LDSEDPRGKRLLVRSTYDLNCAEVYKRERDAPSEDLSCHGVASCVAATRKRVERQKCVTASDGFHDGTNARGIFTSKEFGESARVEGERRRLRREREACIVG